MRLETLTLTNFKCFGEESTKIDFSEDVNAFIGGNGAGKTAALTALSRMFGPTRKQRAIVKSDFHVSGEEQPSGEIILDAVFSFPESESESDQSDLAIPVFWKQLTLGGDSDNHLRARIQLRANWTEDGTMEGSIEEDIRSLDSLEDDVEWEECTKLSPFTRASIQFIYLPATRNVSTQVKELLNSTLFRAIKWSDGIEKQFDKNTGEIQKIFSEQSQINLLEEQINKQWGRINQANTDTDVAFHLVENSFEAAIRNLVVKFFPNEFGESRELELLSDGQKSLFQMALIVGSLETVNTILNDTDNYNENYDLESLDRYSLTLLAIEEPENSLSPFFLSHIVNLALKLTEFSFSQVIFASHSAGLLSRIPVKGVIHFRYDSESQYSVTNNLKLPKKKEESSKYVRLAVKAYPELYFAKFVVLCEGESEQIILNRCAEALGFNLDKSFVPVVPLGGRHVQHFWELLDDLQIPYATLLDFDCGRYGGGINRVKEVAMKFNPKFSDKVLEKFDELTEIEDIGQFDEKEWYELDDPKKPKLDRDGDILIENMGNCNVFFSYPLDIDFAMLYKYYEAYSQIGGIPDFKEEHKELTLKKKGEPEYYSDYWDKYFALYPRLFLNKSKPEVHIAALAELDDKTIKDNLPRVLKRLLKLIKSQIEK